MWNCFTPDSLETKKQLSAENWYVVMLKIHGMTKAFFLGECRIQELIPLWFVWLCWFGVVPQTKSSWVRFLVKHMPRLWAWSLFRVTN